MNDSGRVSNCGSSGPLTLLVLVLALAGSRTVVADSHPFVRNTEPHPFLRSSVDEIGTVSGKSSGGDLADGSVNRLRTISRATPSGAEPGVTNSGSPAEFGDSIPGKAYEDESSLRSGQWHSNETDPDYSAGAPGHSAETPILRYRRTCFQGITLASGTLLSGSGPSLDIHHAAVSAGFGIPLENSDNVLFITPSFRTDLIDAPASVDVPDSLFETGIRFFHIRPFTPTVNGIFSIAPAIRSDFTTGDNAVRIFGIAMLSWTTIPGELKLSAGMVYLDRSDMKALPAAGLMWTPSPLWKIDIQFPQPKISYRTAKNAGVSESWVYLAGGFGGNTWAVTRNSGQSDELTLSDLRLMTGFEQVMADNHNWFVEVGWSFNRELEYTTVPLIQEFGDAFLIRGGVTF